MLTVDIPGRATLVLQAAVLDVNGTVADRGELIDGVEVGLRRLASRLRVVLVSADTFGTVGAIAARLGVEARTVADGEGKVRILDELGRDGCAVVGNGANEVPALGAAALGIAVLGPEGTSREALDAADVVCASIQDALALLGDEQALRATLRR
jgi:P-type E1-E2 ATPase